MSIMSLRINEIQKTRTDNGVVLQYDYCADKLCTIRVLNRFENDIPASKTVNRQYRVKPMNFLYSLGNYSCNTSAQNSLVPSKKENPTGIFEVSFKPPEKSAFINCIRQSSNTMPYQLLFEFHYFSTRSVLLFSTSVNQEAESYFNLPCWNPFLDEIPVSISWTFNLTKRLSQGSDFQSIDSQFPLFFYGVSPQEAGLYQCFVYSPTAGIAVFSYHVSLAQQQLRHVRTRRFLSKRAAPAENARNLELSVEEYSDQIILRWNALSMKIKSFTVKWGEFYPGPKFKTIRGNETQFTIKQLNPQTIYYISITPETENGPLKAVLKDTTTKKKRKVYNIAIPVKLKLEQAGDRWVVLSWVNAGAGELPPHMYRVEYVGTLKPNGPKSYFNSSKTQVTLSQLTPDTKYEFSVQCCIIKPFKCSEWSFIGDFKTLGSSPSDYPRHLTLSSAENEPTDTGSSKKSKFAIQVSWQPPQSPNGKIKNYNILMTAYKNLEIDRWVDRSVSGQNLNAVVDSLDFNHFYYFRIRCSNNYGVSRLSPVRVYKTPNHNGVGGGQVRLSREYFNAAEIKEPLSVVFPPSRKSGRNSTELGSRGNPATAVAEGGVEAMWKSNKWWIILGLILAISLIAAFLIIFLSIYKFKNRKKPNPDLGKYLEYNRAEHIHLVKQQQQPGLTTPDLFRHTGEHTSHKFIEIDNRTDSPHSFGSNKEFTGAGGGGGYNPSYLKKQPTQFVGPTGNPDPQFSSPTGPQLVHQNVIMTTSQLTTGNPADQHYYPVSFLQQMGHHNPMNIFSTATPRVNAAASDFNSINYATPNSDFIPYNGSSATILYESSTNKSSGGKSSLSGSGSCNGFPKVAFVNKPINENLNTAFNEDIQTSPSNDVKKAFSSEELSQEMENLEGLMKDLNHITQKEFEC